MPHYDNGIFLPKGRQVAEEGSYKIMRLIYKILVCNVYAIS
jgi:hypothetical protein